MKIYTKTGDDGTTGLQGNVRVQKTDARIVAYGAADEVNASIGAALAEKADADIRSVLTRVQNELFEMGADLSDPDPGDGPGRVTGDLVRRLEEDIDAFEAELVPLANFILPGGTRLASALHQSRTTARRAEIQVTRLQQSQAVNRNCAKYLNRLSDLLFVIARVANKRGGMPDTVWKSHG